MARHVMGREGRRWSVRRHWAPRLGGASVWDRWRDSVDLLRKIERRMQQDGALLPPSTP